MNQQRVRRRNNRSNRAPTAAGLVVVLATFSACSSGGPNQAPESTSEPTPTSPTSTSTTDGSGTDEADADLVARVVIDDSAGGPTLPADDIEVRKMAVLAPSSCELWEAGDPNVMDNEYTSVVLLDHRSIAVGRSDEQLGAVAQACFLDNGLVPTAEAGSLLVAQLSSSLPFAPGIYDFDPNRPLGTNEVAWQPPSVDPIENGFVVTFIANSFEEVGEFRVTAKLTTVATTGTTSSSGSGNAAVSYEIL